ncbi:MAG TPA: prolyl oligopeptidase family serine peptidase, partial [Chitinophagaceae bacterium]|nr:prolyl oligopeptidase family serine peptidase [Chitinophagaceae bacterium]
NDLYLLTYKNAPHFKIIKTNIIAPDPDNASVVSNESDKTIESISVTKDQLLITQSDGINGNLLKYDFITAKMQAVAANLQGKVSVVYASNKTNIALISSASWNKPYTVYELNTTNGNNKKSIFNSEIKYPGIEDIMVKEVEVKSYDGTMVPLSILYNKKINLDGNNSCILNGYGCYGISNSPRFSILNLAMLQRGVVMAFAHVRGGGEKGESWHKGGYKTTKPNTWKDFIACAEYLVSENYTSEAKLSGTGTSAGGILISRSITERPDLFAAAVCNVGDANALRSEYGTDGPANSKEYGTEKDSVECMALIEMDGLSHVQKNIKYPAVLCATGINDPRVAPWQPGKFAAALQNNTASGNAVLLRVDYDNGHFTEDRSVTFNNFADQFSFLLWQMGHPGFALKKQPY